MQSVVGVVTYVLDTESEVILRCPLYGSNNISHASGVDNIVGHGTKIAGAIDRWWCRAIGWQVRDWTTSQVGCLFPVGVHDGSFDSSYEVLGLCQESRARVGSPEKHTRQAISESETTLVLGEFQALLGIVRGRIARRAIRCHLDKFTSNGAVKGIPKCSGWVARGSREAVRRTSRDWSRKLTCEQDGSQKLLVRRHGRALSGKGAKISSEQEITLLIFTVFLRSNY